MQLKETQATLRAFGKYVVSNHEQTLLKAKRIYLKSCTILLVIP